MKPQKVKKSRQDMKSVLIGINASYSHSAYSIYAISSACEDRENLILKEYNINQPPNNIISDLYLSGARVFMFSCYLWNIEIVLKIASALKKIAPYVILLGGSEVAYTPERYLSDNPFIDGIVCCEGELVIDDILSATSLEDMRLIGGMCMREELVQERVQLAEEQTQENAQFQVPSETQSQAQGNAQNENECSNLNAISTPSSLGNRRNTPKTSYDFSSRPFPYNKDNMSLFENKIIYYETSRGCPYRCSYCISSIEKNMRYVPIEQVERELQFFIDEELSLVKFIDRTFNADRKRASRIISYIIEHNKKTCFHFEVCVELLTDEIVALLKKAPLNYFQIEAGLQTINPSTLKAINRNNRLDIFERHMTNLIETKNLHVHADLIALLPYEDIESFIKGFNYLYKIGPHMFQLGFLKVLHGTQIEKETGEYEIEYLPYPPYEAIKSKWISFEEKMLLKRLDFLIDKIHNTHYYNNALSYIVAKYFDEPYDFYFDLSNYFFERGYFEIGLSKKELYKILMQYSKKFNDVKIDSILAFDFLLNMGLSLDEASFPNIKRVNSQKVFDFLHEKENVDRYLPTHSSLTIKEIFKKVAIYRFEESPLCEQSRGATILFTTDKRENIFKENVWYLLGDDDIIL